MNDELQEKIKESERLFDKIVKDLGGDGYADLSALIELEIEIEKESNK